MRVTVLAITAFCLASTAALACDDHTGTCEIEDWKHTYTSVVQALTIEGVATCNTGTVRIRLYDGEGDARKFFGVETTYIEGTSSKASCCRPRSLKRFHQVQHPDGGLRCKSGRSFCAYPVVTHTHYL